MHNMEKCGRGKGRPQGCSLRPHRRRRLAPLPPPFSPAPMLHHVAYASLLHFGVEFGVIKNRLIAEVKPTNSFLKSVILRVSEARDLGEVNRFQFYDHMKDFTAAPPDVLRVDEKHLREHAILNCTGVIITTNHKADGIYLPADDRCHYVAWSDLSKEDFDEC